MRLTLVPLLLALSVAGPAAAGTSRQNSWLHTRPLTAGAAALIGDISRRAPVVEGLLQELERTDVVVYVSDSVPTSASEPRAYLSFVSYAGGIRYLMVKIDPWRLQPADRAMWLGHELEHALEIASAPEVKDAAGLEQLYRRIGWEVRAGRFESDGAWDVANLVRTERSGGLL